MVTALNIDLQPFLQAEQDEARLGQLIGLLESKGTLSFPVLPSGLFSAAPPSEFSLATNYRAAWVRDNVHVAYAHFVNGHPAVAVKTARALAAFFRTQIPRLDAIIADPARKADAFARPHVRFDGETGQELPQQWAHAQNDALGYFVWLYSTLALAGLIPEAEFDAEVLARFPRYFRAIEYWCDEESGHWEEAVKIEASSIGTVVAGLRRLAEFVRRAGHGSGRQELCPFGEVARRQIRADFPLAGLDDLVKTGETALFRILPAECVQPEAGKFRRYDAALLFLIYPLGIVNDVLAEVIVNQTEQHLGGPFGIKRYLGDSFYCADYETAMAARHDDPTRDFSHDMSGRNALLREGAEAQWCLFDPIISIIYGRLYQRTRADEALRRQTHFLNRSLAQITVADPPRCAAFQCAELYYSEQSKLQVSKSTPLLWTQANLWTALSTMRASLGAGRTLLEPAHY